MAGNSVFNKVKVDTGASRRERFNFSHPASFSLPFGWVAPTMCQKMVQDSEHVVSSKQLCRLKPLVLPVSQGEIEVQTLHQFVGMSDLYRHYSQFQTKQPYQGASNGLVTFTYLPRMRLCDLSAYVLVGCKFSIWLNDQLSVNGYPKYRYPTSDEQTQITTALTSLTGLTDLVTTLASPQFSSRFPDFISASGGINKRVFLPLFNPLWTFTGSTAQVSIPCYSMVKSQTLFNKSVTFDNYDYALERGDLVVDDEPMPIVFLFQLSDYGKRLAFILDMLGYGVDFASTEEVDLSRLFAEYIAYFGAFGLTKYQNYESTPCAKFLRMYEEGSTMFGVVGLSYPSTNIIPDPTLLNTVFVQVLNDIVTQFATDKVDYIASHRISDVTTVNETGWLDNVVYATGGSALSIGQRTGSADDHTAVNVSTMSPYIDRVNHTQVDADLLKLMYKITNRNTVAGRRIAELLRAGGYGKYVDEQKSHFIGRESYTIDIADINATADATSAAGRTSSLGAYVGKGVGGQKADKKFVYETDEVGYWITLTCVIPDSSYCQQTDLTVFDTTPEKQYSTEFDSMGYEVQSKRVYLNGRDWNRLGASASESLDAGFGLVPRYMRYKVSRGVIAGDFKRRSTRSEFLPFVLSRYIDVGSADAVKYDSSDDSYLLNFSSNIQDLPLASPAWRFINKYPWLANFERIFAYEGERIDATPSDSLMSRYIFASFTDDYFELFTYYFYTCRAPMLAIDQSYSTTDDNDGKGVDMTVA